MAIAEFKLKLKDEKLIVEGSIPFTGGKDLPRITLNKNAELQGMKINQYLHYKKVIDANNDYFVSYIPDTETSKFEDGKIEVSYETPIQGWHNCITSNMIAISLYSHAFPLNLPEYIQGSICYFVEGFEEYEIYNAYVDEETGYYAKKTDKIFGEIVNIIGIRKGHLKIYEEEKFRIICQQGTDCSSVCKSIKIGLQAFDYYCEIYGPKEVSRMDVVVLGNGDAGGAYCRGQLIVLGEPPAALQSPELVDMLTYELFAHEFGHLWFGRAEVSTYEDWLNETGAEWSQLLNLLHIGKKDLFDKWIGMRIDMHSKSGEAIKPDDLHHPDTVHSSGVVLFFMIYKTYGEDAVIHLLKILSGLNIQNTENLLNCIEKQYSVDIANFIRKNLNEKIIYE